MERIRIYFKPIWYNIVRQGVCRVLRARDDADIRVHHDIVASGVRYIV